MSLTDLYYTLLSTLGQVTVPKPTDGGSAPEPLKNLVTTGLNLIAWGGTAAGVVGVLVTGAMMAMSHKRGESSEHMGRLGIVLGGCVLIATAGPIVEFVFNNGAAGETPQQQP